MTDKQIKIHLQNLDSHPATKDCNIINEEVYKSIFFYGSNYTGVLATINSVESILDAFFYTNNFYHDNKRDYKNFLIYITLIIRVTIMT